MDTEIGRVAVMVCYDLEFPEWTRLAALDGADLIAAPVNWPGYRWPAGERPAEVIKAQAAAAASGVFVAVADRCRIERGVSWISGSLIVGPDGYPLAGPVLADRPAVLPTPAGAWYPRRHAESSASRAARPGRQVWRCWRGRRGGPPGGASVRRGGPQALGAPRSGPGCR